MAMHVCIVPALQGVVSTSRPLHPSGSEWSPSVSGRWVRSCSRTRRSTTAASGRMRSDPASRAPRPHPPGLCCVVVVPPFWVLRVTSRRQVMLTAASARAAYSHVNVSNIIQYCYNPAIHLHNTHKHGCVYLLVLKRAFELKCSF